MSQIRAPKTPQKATFGHGWSKCIYCKVTSTRWLDLPVILIWKIHWLISSVWTSSEKLDLYLTNIKDMVDPLNHWNARRCICDTSWCSDLDHWWILTIPVNVLNVILMIFFSFLMNLLKNTFKLKSCGKTTSIYLSYGVFRYAELMQNFDKINLQQKIPFVKIV